jgi:AraC family transcriptional regulator, positive regulator of tynA and feaB
MTALFVSSAAVADKHHFWERTIDETFGSVDMKIADETSFFGEIRRSPLGTLGLIEIACASEMATRTRRHIAHDKEELFILVLLRSGRLQIGQRDRECVLTPGTFALFDLNTPYTFRHLEPTNVLDLTIPGALLRSRLHDPHQFAVRPYAAGSGIGRITADFLGSLAREVDHVPEPATHAYCCRTVDLVGVLLESEGEDLPIAYSAVRSALYKRCAAIIDNHLADPALDPAKIAASAGISARYLHRIFQDAGDTVGSYLLRRRLELCHRDLSDPAKRNLPVSAIAYRVGFHSSSHFANSFKRRYGVSPNELRQMNVG